jgi:hypothetical protein
MNHETRNGSEYNLVDFLGMGRVYAKGVGLAGVV